MRGRGAFQEMDFGAVFGSIAKYCVEIDDPARIPEIVARAFHVAMSGRPGPVVVSLPEDMLVEQASVSDCARVERTEISPGGIELDKLHELLAGAKRPIAILGGGGWDAKACMDFERFAQRYDLPVVASFRRTSLFDMEHANYAGELALGANPKLVARVKESDLVLLIGGGAGAYFAGLLDPLLGVKKEVAEGEGAESGEKQGPKGPAGPSVFFDMPEMVVTLNTAQRKTTFLKIRVALEVARARELLRPRQPASPGRLSRLNRVRSMRIRMLPARGRACGCPRRARSARSPR
jgi:hypothetical protein